jgi:DNA-binding response OmpR family regulator
MVLTMKERTDNVTQLLAAFMKRHNYSYQEAEDGQVALDAYQNISAKFQTILMDMSMPISKLFTPGLAWGIL